MTEETMSDIKVICCDIDGTLVRDDKTLSDENAKWIHKAVHEAGVHFTLVSGRPVNGVRPFYQRMGITGPVSCFNGGTLVDENGDIVDDHRMPHDLAVQICKIGKHLPVDIIIFNGMKWYLRTRDCYCYAQKKKIYESECGIGEPLQLLNTFDTNKIIFMSPSKDVLKTAMAEIEKKVEKGRITYYSNADFLEMMPSGYDKSSAIDALAKLFDVKLSQIMALGDDYNDVPMLKRAGCSVAMANAVPEAKAAAKYITDTNNNDGVAKAIQKYVFGIDN